MKGRPDFTPSGALGDGVTSCPYRSSMFMATPGQREPRAARTERIRGRRGKGEPIKNDYDWIFAGGCKSLLNCVDICRVYAQDTCMHGFQPSHLIKPRQGRLCCASSYLYTWGVEMSQDCKMPEKQWPKHPENSINSGNITARYNNSGPACNHSKTPPSLLKNCSNSDILRLPRNLSPTSKQRPILKPGAIAQMWCTAPGHNFP